MKLNAGDIGKTLFDIRLNEFGRVERFGDRAVHVVFAGGVRMSYRDDGTEVVSGAKRLFWHPPVVVDPPEDARQWQVIKNAAQAVSTAVQATGI